MQETPRDVADIEHARQSSDRLVHAEQEFRVQPPIDWGMCKLALDLHRDGRSPREIAASLNVSFRNVHALCTAQIHREKAELAGQTFWYDGLNARTVRVLQTHGRCKSKDDVFRLAVRGALSDVVSLGPARVAEVRKWLCIEDAASPIPIKARSVISAIALLERNGFVVIRKSPPKV